MSSRKTCFHPSVQHRFVTTCTLAVVAGALSYLTGCTETTSGGARSTSYNPVAYKPHNASAVRVKVSLSKQVVYVMEGNKPLLVAATTGGIPGHATPTGNFTITRKEKDKRSGSYGFYKRGDVIVPAEAGHGSGEYIGYPMAFWCEFKPEFGFHQGYVWPVPRSHGCLRLHPNVAPKFFAIVHPGQHRQQPAGRCDHRRKRAAPHGLPGPRSRAVVHGFFQGLQLASRRWPDSVLNVTRRSG